MRNVTSGIWVPCGRCIFKVRSDQSSVDKCFSIRWTTVNIATNEVESLGCLCRYIVDVLVPMEVVGYRDTEVWVRVYY